MCKGYAIVEHFQRPRNKLCIAESTYIIGELDSGTLMTWSTG